MLTTLSLHLRNKREGASPCACKHSSTSFKKNVEKLFFNITFYCKKTCKLPKYLSKERKNVNILYKVLATIWNRADDDRIVFHDATHFMLYYHCVRDTSWSVIFSTREVNIAVLDVDVFQNCFGSAASAFESIELACIHCAWSPYAPAHPWLFTLFSIELH